MRVHYLPVVFSLILVACAEEPPAGLDALSYSKAGATQDDFMEDRRTCLTLAEHSKTTSVEGAYGGEASSQVVVKCDALSACLTSRGYQEDPKGELVPPPEMVIQCH